MLWPNIVELGSFCSFSFVKFPFAANHHATLEGVSHFRGQMKRRRTSLHVVAIPYVALYRNPTNLGPLDPYLVICNRISLYQTPRSLKLKFVIDESGKSSFKELKLFLWFTFFLEFTFFLAFAHEYQKNLMVFENLRGFFL